MSDDLAAFFAKKSKGKKKGVKLQEIAEQLERKVKIQEQNDELDDENKQSEVNLAKSRNIIDNNEDSEWLDFNEKVNIPLAIKEMDDVDIEYEGEEKQSSVEPTKTWNVASTEEQETETTQPAAPKVWKSKHSTNKQLDISSEMAFPSLDNAAEIEIQLKKEEEEKRIIDLQEKRRKEEEEKRAEEKRQNTYHAPRGTDQEGRKRPERRQEDEFGNTEADSTENWRGQQQAPRAKQLDEQTEVNRSPQTQPVDKEIRRKREEQPPIKETEADSAGDWRMVQRENARKVAEETPTQEKKERAGSPPSVARRFPTSTTDTDSNWRTRPSITPKTEEKPTSEAPPPKEAPKSGGGKYQPPSMRRQQT